MPCAPFRRLSDAEAARVMGLHRNHTAGKGTFVFEAPEQLTPDYDKAVDIWACGVVAYKMVTGNFPFGTAIDYMLSARKVGRCAALACSHSRLPGPAPNARPRNALIVQHSQLDVHLCGRGTLLCSDDRGGMVAHAVTCARGNFCPAMNALCPLVRTAGRGSHVAP